MNRRILTITSLLFCLLSGNFLYAKSDDFKLPKFGKFDESHLSAEVCPMDSDAHGYFIYNTGVNQFDYSPHTGFSLNQDRHFLIKILDENAFEWADVSIPLYKGSEQTDRVFGLKAVTYNLVNGEITETKLEKDDIFMDDANPVYAYQKFTMPDVKAGSIIEVSYTLNTIYAYEFDDWYVQQTIPILQTYFLAKIPDFFYYKQMQRGYLGVHFNQSTKRNTINLGGGETYDYVENTYELERKNIPAFKIEPYLRTTQNYISAMSFELSYQEFPGQLRKSFSSTWEDVCNKLRKSSSVCGRLSFTGFTKDMAETIGALDISDEAKIGIAYRHIQRHFTWNGEYGLYTDQALRNAYSDQKGNDAEINLTMVALLKEMGYNAYPVALSTQKHGMILEYNATLSGLNYIIAGVTLDGKQYLMDATDPFADVNMLPYRCLNYQGITLGNETKWVSLIPAVKDNSRAIYSLKLNEDGSLTGFVKFSDSDYAAYDKRKAIKRCNSTSEYIENLEKEFTGLKINSYKFENLDTLSKPLLSTFNITIENGVQDAGGILLFNPFMLEARENNPFKSETRDYPVEFDTYADQTVTVMIELPEGFVLDEAPEAVRIVMPDKSMFYSYSVSASGNNIVANSVYKRAKCQYLPSDYGALKAFYGHIITKENSSVVIKKSEELSSAE